MNPKLLLFFFLLRVAWSGSSVKLRIHQDGINFVGNVVKTVAEKELRELHIPDQEFRNNGFRIKIFRTEFSTLNLPTTNVTFQDGGLLVTTHGGFVYGGFRVQAIKWVIAKITVGGRGEFWLRDLNMQVLLKWKKGTAKPQLEVASCKGHLDSSRIELHGNVIIGLINMFKGQIGQKIKDGINSKICTIVPQLIQKRLNKFLADMPSLFPVTKEGKRIFSIQYENLKTFVGKDFMDVSANAAFLFNKKNCTAIISKEFPDVSTKHMITAWASQGVPDCLLHAFHDSNQLQFLITDKMKQAAKYLRTTCPNIDGNFLPKCIGALFPKLTEQYPNRTVDVLAYSISAPYVTIVPNGIKVRGYIALNLTIDHTFLARFDVNLTSVIVPHLKGSHFNGSVNIQDTSIRLVTSKIGQIDETILKIAGPILSAGANMILQPIADKGIMIQDYMGVGVADSSDVLLLDGYIRSDVNIVKKK